MKINPTDLFTEENAVNRGSFFKFADIGSRLYGTLTGIRRGQDGYGNEQTIYEVLTQEGEYKLFGNKKPIIDDYMKHVRLGQIVGFELVERRQIPGRKNPANIIQPYASPKLVNEEWVKENQHLIQSSLRTPNLEEAVESDSDLPFDDEPLGDGPVEPQPEVKKPRVNTRPVGSAKIASPAPATMTRADKVKEIGELAQKKLGATDTSDIKNKVMEATEIAFVEKNLDEILTKMRDL
jgi:hypothetical protein